MRTFFIAVFYSITTLSCAQELNDSLITLLKKEINQKEIYVHQKRKNIEVLNDKLGQVKNLTPAKQFELYNELYHQYKTFIYDSAFKYVDKLIETAYQLKDKSRIGYGQVKYSFILLSSGMFKETLDTLRVVETKYLDDSTKVHYYWLMGRVYSDLNHYNKAKNYIKAYTDLNQLYLDSALQWCPQNSYQHYYLTVVKNAQVHNYQKVIDAIEELLQYHTLTLPQLAVNYYDLSNAYKGLNKPDKTLEFIIKSSLCDIRAATKETAAMYTLAKLLHDRGDEKNAAVFIKQALDDAEFYGARQRMVEIGSILPVIASAELNSSKTQSRIWLSYAVGLSVVLALVMLFSFIIFTQLKKLKTAELRITEANNALQETILKLTEANTIKEEFISYYFSINSAYLEKIESFKRSIERKLTSKKYDDIQSIINSVNIKREREELFFSFDKVFLKLFPDFVNTFNTYFKPEDRMILKEGQLNTELRIFALIRMGTTDAEDIARILNYSVNTIYTYKTKIRSKSILPNDAFDQRIMEINSK